MTKRTLNILLVEDDDVAAEGVRRSLRRSALDCPVTHAEDGVEALRVLRSQHPTLSVEPPFLVLLDLNMPRMNGLEFLREVRADAELRRTVVFVLTTSDTEIDRSRAYHHSIAGYMVKSAIGPQFRGLTSLLSEYRDAVVLPQESAQ